MFHETTYTERRKYLKEKVGGGLILLFGNEESPMNYEDNTYPFRQDSTFLYYFGIQRPGLAAVIDIENDREVIFGDEFTIDDFVWRGPQVTIAEMAASCGVKDVQPYLNLPGSLERARQAGQTIHYLPLYRPENKIKLQELIGIAPKQVAASFSVDLVKTVVSQREYKTEEEISQISGAVDVTVDMHVAAMKFAKPGMTEAQVTARIHEVALAAGGDISFPIIATINGQTLHNHYHGNTIKEGDLFLVDAGFENRMCYGGDLSSTFPVSKKFNFEQKEIYQLTLEAHQAAIDALGLDKPFKDAHVAACKTIFEGLKTMGFTKGNFGDAFEDGGPGRGMGRL